MMKSFLFATVLLLLSSPLALATTINFEEFPADNANGAMPAGRYAYLGVTFTGTDDGSTWDGLTNGDPGSWELEGTNGPTFSGYNGSSYAMTLTLPGQFASFSLDVSRSLGSDAADTFTLEGYLNSALVETHTVPLATINDWTTVSLTMKTDEVRWFGTGAGFHPYGIDNINFEVVPEPSSLALLGLGALGLVGVARRRRNAS